MSSKQKSVILKYQQRIDKKLNEVKQENANVTGLLEEQLNQIVDKVNSLQKCNNEKKKYTETNKLIEKFIDKLYKIIDILCSEDSDSVEDSDNNAEVDDKASLKDSSDQKESSECSTQNISSQNTRLSDTISNKPFVHNAHSSTNSLVDDKASFKEFSDQKENSECSYQNIRSQSSLLSDAISNKPLVYNFHSSNNSLQTDKPIIKPVESFPNCHDVKNIPSINIEVGSNIAACLSTFLNLSDFWLEVWIDESAYSKSLHLNNIPPSRLDESDLKINQYCLAPLSPSTPYQRGRIKNIYSEGSKTMITVFYIDLGFSKKIDVNCLQKMPNFFYAFPARAIHCSIANVLPIENTWSKEANDCAERFIRGTDPTVLIVAKLDQKFEVDFRKVLEGEVLQLSDHLRFLDFAVIKSSVEDNTSIPENVNCETVPKSIEYEAKSFHQGNAYSSSIDSLPSAHLSISSCEYHDYLKEENIKTNSTLIINQKQINGSTSSVNSSNLSTSAKSFKPQNQISFSPDLSLSEFDWNLEISNSEPTFIDIERNLLLIMPFVIYSPDDFYAHIAHENSGVLDDLQEQMTNFYKHTDNMTKLMPKRDDIKIGSYCCFEDPNNNCWYRAQILEIQSNCADDQELLAKVQYVDYGDSIFVPVNSLRPLTKAFAKYPAFAFLFSLANIQPKPSPVNEHLLWNTDAIEKFKQLIDLKQDYTAEVIGSKILFDERRTLDVVLWDSTKKGEKNNINAILVEKELAIYIDNFPEINKCESENNSYLPLEWNPMQDDFINVHNTYKNSDADVGLVFDGFTMKDESYICKFYASKGSCYRKGCTFKHIRVGEDDVTREGSLVVAPNNYIPFPKLHTSVIGQISSIITPSHFYLVFPYGTESYAELAYKDMPESGRVTEYEKLNDSMNSHYNSAPFNEDTTLALPCGALVAARSKHMDMWLRAKVLDVIDVVKPIQVVFVDVGNVEWVERINVRKLKLEYIHLPFQAVECFLNNIEPYGYESGQKWSDKSKEVFEEIVVGKMLTVYIEEVLNTTLYIKLTLIEKDGVACINDLLVDVGFAQYRKREDLSEEVNIKKSIELKNGFKNYCNMNVEPG